MTADPVHPVPRATPFGVTLTAILSIVAGALALLSGVMGLIALLLSDVVSAAFTVDGPMQAAQQQLQEATAAINQQFLIPNVILHLASIGAGTLLVLGGRGLLAGRAPARRSLMRVFPAVIVVDLLFTGLTYAVQIALMPAWEQYFEALPGGSALPIKMSMTFSLVISGVWLVAKIGLLLVGYFYLKRPSVLSHFGEAARA